MRYHTGARVAGLFRYPIKSCRAIKLQTAELDPYGFVDDRRGMVVTPEGKFLTQREHPKMALIKASLNEYRLLNLDGPGMCPFSISLFQRDKISPSEVTIWEDKCQATDQGDFLAHWFSTYLGTTCRFVWTPDGFERPVDRRFARHAQVGFADGFPILITTTASLDQLNAWHTEAGHEPVPMDRFRPNLVIGGTEPFEEDRWDTITLEPYDIELQIVKPCSRCEIIEIDQETGQRTGGTLLTTLAKHRLQPSPTSGKLRPMFGQYAVIRRRSAIARLDLRDPVEIKYKRQ